MVFFLQVLLTTFVLALCLAIFIGVPSLVMALIFGLVAEGAYEGIADWIKAKLK